MCYLAKVKLCVGQSHIGLDNDTRNKKQYNQPINQLDTIFFFRYRIFNSKFNTVKAFLNGVYRTNNIWRGAMLSTFCSK